MKRTISTLALAAPLATVALSLGATPAMAQPAEPIDELTIAELSPDIQPEIPEEELPQPEDPDPEDPDLPESDVPDDKVPTPRPCGTPGDPGDDPSDEDEQDPGSEDPEPRHWDEDEPGDEDEDGDQGDIPRPNCIDAGAASNDSGMQLAWLMAGGGLITATGAAYAVRRRSSMGA